MTSWSPKFGPYPFDAIGGIVVDDRRIRFALENQSRPIYSFAFFDPPGTDGTGVIVHELAHQWYGDSVSVNEWKDIWLNEGFATYAEWLWTEEQKQETAQQIFDNFYSRTQKHDVERDHRRPRRGGSVRLRWRLPAGWHDPARVAGHGRRRRLLQGVAQGWAVEKRDANATTTDFIAVAERISGKQLDDLFQAWLFGKVRPPRPTG